MTWFFFPEAISANKQKKSWMNDEDREDFFLRFLTLACTWTSFKYFSSISNYKFLSPKCSTECKTGSWCENQQPQQHINARLIIYEEKQWIKRRLGSWVVDDKQQHTGDGRQSEIADVKLNDFKKFHSCEISFYASWIKREFLWRYLNCCSVQT